MKIISKKHKINASVVFVVDVVLKSQFVVAEIKKGRKREEKGEIKELFI